MAIPFYAEMKLKIRMIIFQKKFNTNMLHFMLLIQMTKKKCEIPFL